MPDFPGPGDNEQGSFDEFLARYLAGQRASQAGRPIDISRFLSRRTQELLQSAAQYALSNGHSELDALHILHTMANQAPVAETIRRTKAAS